MPIICRPYSNLFSADPNFNNVALLLHFDGAAGSSSIIDSSPLKNTSTVSNVTLASSPAKFGSAGVFNGSGKVAFPPAPGRFGTSDFTIECWFYPQVRLTNYPTIFNNFQTWFSGNGAVSIFAGHGSGGVTKYSVALNGSFPAIVSAVEIVQNTWVHLALVRHNNVITFYVGGISQGTATVPAGTVLDGNGNITCVGSGDDAGNGYINGNIDEFRITKGVARYTANFTPPDTPFSDI